MQFLGIITIQIVQLQFTINGYTQKASGRIDYRKIQLQCYIDITFVIKKRTTRKYVKRTNLLFLLDRICRLLVGLAKEKQSDLFF